MLTTTPIQTDQPATPTRTQTAAVRIERIPPTAFAFCIVLSPCLVDPKS